MPRKFSSIDRNKWLNEYEGGKPEASIASGAECDVRTIKKGIEDARRERDVRVARIELLKDVMSKHNEAMLGKLGEISASLQVPPRDWTVLSWHDNGESVFSERSTDMGDGEDTEGDIEDAEKRPRRASRKGQRGSDVRGDEAYVMLKQHLRNDKLWKHLALRERAYGAHRLAKMALQLKVVEILEKETGYEMESRSNVLPPYICSYTAGDLFYKMTLRIAFGDYKHDA
jgi:hypothetical protein